MLLGVYILAPLCKRGSILLITTDNLGNAFAINKGSCHSEASFGLLNHIFDVAAQHRVFLAAEWVPREHNHLLDLLPRVDNVPHLRSGTEAPQA